MVSTKPSLAQFTSLFTTGKKSSFNRPNYTSIQVFHFKISVKKKHRKKIRFDKQNFFFVTSIKFVACALRENLSNRSSRVQIPHDICTRFGRYLYSTRCSWIIRVNICASIVCLYRSISRKKKNLTSNFPCLFPPFEWKIIEYFIGMLNLTIGRSVGLLLPARSLQHSSGRLPLFLLAE